MWSHGRSRGSWYFWKDRDGRFFVRIFSQGYNYHFEALLASGKQIPEGKMDEFGEWVSDVLLECLVEGVAMPPEGIYKPYTLESAESEYYGASTPCL